MTPEEWANGVGLHWLPPPHQGVPDLPKNYDEVVRAIREAVAEERAACLMIAEKWYEGHPGSKDIADEIRTRGNP